MKLLKLFIALLLIFPYISKAETYYTINGTAIKLPQMPTWKIETKVYILMSGLPYIATNLIPIAKAADFSLREEIEMWHDLIANRFGVSSRETKEVNQCESQWNDFPEKAITIPGDKGKAYGIAQFHEKTFNLWRRESKMPQLEYKSWKDQLTLQGWAFSKGTKYKNDWTCYVMIFIDKTRPISTNWK